MCLIPLTALRWRGEYRAFLRFATWNVGAVVDLGRLTSVLAMARAKGVDVLALQETKIT